MSDSTPRPEIWEIPERPTTQDEHRSRDELGTHDKPESPGAGATASPSAPPSAPQAYEPAAPEPLGVARVPTGNADVDAGLERLGDADHLPADGHLEVYEDVHRGLRDALTALDARPAPAPAGPSPTPSYNYRS